MEGNDLNINFRQARDQPDVGRREEQAEDEKVSCAMTQISTSETLPTSMRCCSKPQPQALDLVSVRSRSMVKGAHVRRSVCARRGEEDSA